jgi:hypothetical protein
MELSADVMVLLADLFLTDLTIGNNVDRLLKAMVRIMLMRLRLRVKMLMQLEYLLKYTKI